MLAGTTAIEAMGGPWAGFCAGRIDDDDNTDSLPLGPSTLQYTLWPCGSSTGNPNNGNCTSPLGTNVVGLIYVDPHGPMGVTDASTPAASLASAAQSAKMIRDVFDRMSMNDSETVALIGGGHAVGKAHGACSGAGTAPNPDVPEDSWWAGTCGPADSFGKGMYATTAGFEGAWTTNPTRFDNEYFNNLLDFTWNLTKGPDGITPQWQVAVGGPTSPFANGTAGQPLMMLTTDIALTLDANYSALVAQFAKSDADFRAAFAAAWYKLVTRDMGPVTRCFAFGDMLPAPAAFQHPLPAPAAKQPVWADVVSSLRASTTAQMNALRIRLAWQCASTYRSSDYLGGCNGARIMFAKAQAWPENKGLDSALANLQPTFEAFAPSGLSWADLIVLAGTVAVEDAGSISLTFCGGRSDAVADDGGWYYLQSSLTGGMADSDAMLMDKIDLLGLAPREFVALAGAHSLGLMHANVSGYEGSWVAGAGGKLTNQYYKNLVELQYSATTSSSGLAYYQATSGGGPVQALHFDLLLRQDSGLLQFVVEFAGSQDAWLAEFGVAWTKLMNADRYNGPTGSFCVTPVTPAPPPPGIGIRKLVGAGMIGVAASAAVATFGAFLMYRRHQNLGRKALARLEEEEEALNDPLLDGAAN